MPEGAGKPGKTSDRRDRKLATIRGQKEAADRATRTGRLGNALPSSMSGKKPFRKTAWTKWNMPKWKVKKARVPMPPISATAL